VTRGRRKRGPAASRHDQRWADLADLMLIIAREIQFRGYTNQDAVPLSQSEGMVMRHLQDEPEVAPSRIASATGLQRTNLSTVLGGLERKGLIERRQSLEDGRGVTVHLTTRGKNNYALVRQEWAEAVSDAAAGDSSDLDCTLTLLAKVEAGLISTRPRPTDSRA